MHNNVAAKRKNYTSRFLKFMTVHHDHASTVRDRLGLLCEIVGIDLGGLGLQVRYPIVGQKLALPVEIDFNDGHGRVVTVMIAGSVESEAEESSLVSRRSQRIEQTLRWDRFRISYRAIDDLWLRDSRK